MYKDFFAYYTDIMLNALATYYAPNYGGIISRGLLAEYANTSSKFFEIYIGTLKDEL